MARTIIYFLSTTLNDQLNAKVNPRNDILKLNHIAQIKQSKTMQPPRQPRSCTVSSPQIPKFINSAVRLPRDDFTATQPRCNSNAAAAQRRAAINPRRGFVAFLSFAFSFQALELRAGRAGVTINDLIFRNMFAISVLNALSRVLWKANPSWLIVYVIRISASHLTTFFFFFSPCRGFCRPIYESKNRLWTLPFL